MTRIHYPNSFGLIVGLLLFFISGVSAGAAERIFVFEAGRTRLKVHDGPIVTGTDSVFSRIGKFERNVDYRIDYLAGAINLTSSKLLEGDTIKVSYLPLPRWLSENYGVIPEAAIGTGEETPPIRASTPLLPGGSPTGNADLIRGTKTFSVLTRNQQTAQFGQTLELSMHGEIAPGLEIQGAVADRGYDPVYGAVNSRISELDKLNFKIISRHFQGEIGHLNIVRSITPYASSTKQLSGLRAGLRGQVLSAETSFGRPPGRFATTRFSGRDQSQGPYRIQAGNVVSAVVSGSEKVWVDGRLLERGADKDYIMDYPGATITFMPRIIIDARSRVEIDFEPLTADYQREYFQTAVGVSSADSAIAARVGFIREGDNKDQLRIGDLTADDRALLQKIGDATDWSFKDGAVADSAGDYEERFDTAGVRYFQYVGTGRGEYRVGFTAVGSGRGDYVFAGGNEYRYVGAARGDYVAQIRVPVPARDDLVETELTIKPVESGRLTFLMRQSNSDRNLYSSRNDNNNLGGQYIASIQFGRVSSVALDGDLNIINKNFRQTIRITGPDRERKYLMPSALAIRGDDRELGASLSARMPAAYNIRANISALDLTGQFRSRVSGIALVPGGNSPWPAVEYTGIDSRLDTSSAVRKGKGDIFRVASRYGLAKNAAVSGSFKFDRRRNDYSGEKTGTRENEFNAGCEIYGVALNLGIDRQDTLTDKVWSRWLTRDRISLRTSGRLGALRSELFAVGQRLAYRKGTENQGMMRVNLAYVPTSSNLSANIGYALSDENRFERGLRYIEVDPGQGRFVLRDGQYIPDANGNYIEIEEIRSDQAPVTTGEKSFGLTYLPGAIQLRLSSNVTEELLKGKARSSFWLLPFYSPTNKPYLNHRIYHSGELKLLRRSGYYLVNLSGSYDYEARRLGDADYRRTEKALHTKLQEGNERWRYFQTGDYFEYKSDNYYSAAGDITGWAAGANIVRDTKFWTLGGGAEYRRAEDSHHSRSKLFKLKINPRIRNSGGGETALELEGYVQKIEQRGFLSYRLTDDYSGPRGLRWAIRTDHRLGETLRLNLSVTGRHAAHRNAIIEGKGDLVASF